MKEQTFKKNIKLLLNSLPFGVGSTFIIKPVKKILNIFNFKKKMTVEYRFKYAEIMANIIISIIDKKPDKMIVVYDNSVSPPTIGDLLNVIMLARYLQLKGMHIVFYIVNDEYRSDWSVLSNREKEDFVNFQKELVAKFTSKLHIEIKVMNWLDYHANSIIHNLLGEYIVCDNVISQRTQLYADSFNILNFLIANEGPEIIDAFLLSKDEFKPANFKKSLPTKYITWHVRINKLWGTERNLTEEAFLNYENRLRIIDPSLNIILISDKDGCDHYMNIANKHNLKIYCSKDFGDSFFDDCYLILNADFYYQLLGGGIGMIPIFSSIPYEVVDRCTNEISWSYPQFTSWAHSRQNRYFDINEVKSPH
jgi:hypothetical protein